MYELRRVRRSHHEADRDRHQHDPGLQGAVAETELEVLREEERRSEHRELRERDRGRGRGEPWVLEDADIEHRSRRVTLPPDERREERGADCKRCNHDRRGPPVVGRFDDGEEERHQGEDGEDGAQWIERALVAGAGIRDEPVREEYRDRAHGHVDQEHGRPPEVLDEEPTQQRAERDPDAGDTGPDPDGACALARDMEGVGDDRQRRGVDECSAQPHEAPGHDQHSRGRCERRERGEGPEPDQAESQRVLAPVSVTERPRGEQQARKHDRVRVHDPLEIGARRAEVAHDCRQRDVEHRVVDSDHDDAQRQHAQRPPTP